RACPDSLTPAHGNAAHDVRFRTLKLAANFPPENPEARSRKKLGRKLNRGGAGALPSRAGRGPGSSGHPLVSETTDEDAFSLRRGSPCPSLGAGARAVRRRR